MQNLNSITSNAKQPVVRVARGRFASEKNDEVRRLLAKSATTLGPAIRALKGLLYYHAGVDAHTSTVVNVSIWETDQDASQMDTLAPMLAERPILEAAGVTFDKNANYEPEWKIEGGWSFAKGDSR
jgi:hypothetical protein